MGIKETFNILYHRDIDAYVVYLEKTLIHRFSQHKVHGVGCYLKKKQLGLFKMHG